jgi:cyclopropane fatty-acyl-phospholipid synthase-like methyltransferase
VDLNRPLDLSRDRRHLDESGTPAALIELARQHRDLVVLDGVRTEAVLVEYPMGRIWRAETQCVRFVRLRTPLDGKRYALVRARPLAATGRGRDGPAPPPMPLLPYVEQDPVGARLGLEGAGIMAYMTGDQMHPPMVDDADLWRDAARWPEAAREHTRAAGRLAKLRAGQHVLDIGCGICGPARQLVSEFGVSVHGVANSELMLTTARELNARRPEWRDGIELEWHDCQDPYRRVDHDAAWSMNMLYRVADKRAMLTHVADAVRPGGQLMIEDWMLTDQATIEDRNALAQHYGADTFADVPGFMQLLEECGFQVIAREDLGHIGRTHLATFHNPVFDAQVRPQLERDFPDPPTSGKQMADEWTAGIDESVRLYKAGRLTYLRLVAATASSGH